MTSDEIREEIEALITRAEGLKPHERHAGWCSSADAAHAALRRAVRYDARARYSPKYAHGFGVQAKGELRDGVTFALAAYMLYLEGEE